VQGERSWSAQYPGLERQICALAHPACCSAAAAGAGPMPYGSAQTSATAWP